LKLAWIVTLDSISEKVTARNGRTRNTGNGKKKLQRPWKVEKRKRDWAASEIDPR
jgi:hypothetical protein